MATNNRDDESWRRHEVPTYTQAEDTWLLGLSLKQLLAIGIVLAVAGALYQLSPLSFLSQPVRIAIAVTFGAAGAGFIIIRPGGRSMFTIIRELLTFLLSSKEYVDTMEDLISPESQAEKDARLAEEGMDLSYFSAY